MEIPQDFGSLFFVLFCGVMSVLLGIFAFIAHSIRDDFKAMSTCLNELAQNLASLTATVKSLDRRLEKLEETGHH